MCTPNGRRRHHNRTLTHRYISRWPNRVGPARDRLIEPLDAFVDWQKTVRARRRRQQRRAGAAAAGGGGGGGQHDGDPLPPAGRAGGSAALTRSKALRMLRKAAPARASPPSRRPVERTSPLDAGAAGATAAAPIRGLLSVAASPAAGGVVFRGLAALPVALGVPPACVGIEEKIGALTPAQVQAVFEPPGRQLRQLLCPGAQKGRRDGGGGGGGGGGSGGGGGGGSEKEASGVEDSRADGAMSPLSPTMQEALDLLVLEAGQAFEEGPPRGSSPPDGEFGF